MERIVGLGLIRIPRYAIIDQNETVSFELHGYSDSSLILYCGVAYVRVILNLILKYIFWKYETRLAPLKKISIPRLEMLACLLLTE